MDMKSCQHDSTFCFSIRNTYLYHIVLRRGSNQSIAVFHARYPALGYEGDWRISGGSPPELQPLHQALHFQLLDNKSEPRLGFHHFSCGMMVK